MTHTIDTLMALAYKIRDARTYEWDVSEAVEADKALRAALTEALSKDVAETNFGNMQAEPVCTVDMDDINAITWNAGHDGVGLGSPLYAAPQAAQPVASEFEDLLDKYWNLAYSEGQSGQSFGTEANEVLHKLRSLKGAQPVREPDHFSAMGNPISPHRELIAELRKPMHYLSMKRRNQCADALSAQSVREPTAGLNPLWVATHPDGLPQPVREPMSPTELRTRFEAEYRRLYPVSCYIRPNKFVRDGEDSYAETIVNVAWNLWKAAHGIGSDV
jgi:hypothetical protein